MVQMCRLHRAGMSFPLYYKEITRAGIPNFELTDFSHFVWDGYRVRVVGFSEARRHKCPGCYPKVQKGDEPPATCRDLLRIEAWYGSRDFDKNGNVRIAQCIVPWVSSSQLGGVPHLEPK